MSALTPAEKSMAVALSKAATSSGYGLLGGPLRRVLAKAAVAHDTTTAPDWADVREAARKAGYRLSRRGPVDTPSPRTKVVRWDLEPLSRNPDGDPGGGFNLVHWWQFRDGEEDAGITVEIDLDDYNGTEAHVWDATPARAMNGLRLVGLGGDSDGQ
jgi:hypothetical protein